MRFALLRPLLLLVLLALLVAGAKVASGWWRGELQLDEEGNWIWLALLPLSLLLWWRYFSVFGCEKPACLLPPEQRKDDQGAGSR